MRRDPLMDHILKNMEKIFTPKTVTKPNDWLACHKEKG